LYRLDRSCRLNETAGTPRGVARVPGADRRSRFGAVFADTLLTLPGLRANHYATRRSPPGIALAASVRQGPFDRPGAG
jgi:hypothetical protein